MIRWHTHEDGDQRPRFGCRDCVREAKGWWRCCEIWHDPRRQKCEECGQWKQALMEAMAKAWEP